LRGIRLALLFSVMVLPPKRSGSGVAAADLQPYALAVLIGLSMGLLLLSLVGILLMGEGL
jgi:hypothetical protein